MSKHCCKVSMIPENMQDGAIESIYKEISDTFAPHLIRKTKEDIIVIVPCRCIFIKI